MIEELALDSLEVSLCASLAVTTIRSLLVIVTEVVLVTTELVVAATASSASSAAASATTVATALVAVVIVGSLERVLLARISNQSLLRVEGLS